VACWTGLSEASHVGCRVPREAVQMERIRRIPAKVWSVTYVSQQPSMTIASDIEVAPADIIVIEFRDRWNFGNE
jgi:hypothetical protein